MFVLLPILAGIVLFLIFYKTLNCWRKAIVATSLSMGVLVVVFSETLSIFRLVGLIELIAVWSAVIITSGFYYIKHCQAREVRESNSPFFPPLAINLLVKKPITLILLSGIGLIILSVSVIAIVAPPNNWDSMTYHMNRVVHWMQNHSVYHYPTYYLPQLFHPPFSSFAILHLQILSGGDRFANSVQWLSMTGSIIGVSLIAKQLGAGWRGQIFAAVFCATLPMGILEGSSTQNDYVVTFWLVCFTYCSLLIVASGITKNRLLGLAASLSLAILTKTSAYFYVFPFSIWLLFWAFKTRQKNIWKPILFVAGFVVLLNFNHYWRNLELFGSLLGAPADYQKEYKIEVISLPTFVSNIIRNLSIHLDIIRNLGLEGIITPITGIAEKLILILHKILGVSVNDPRTTWPPNSFSVAGLSFDENTASNPLHFFLIITAIILFISRPSLKKDRYILSYLAALVGGFLVLCLLLKWQPYHSRHHLYLFVSFSAFVAVVFSKTFNKKALFALAMALLIIAMPWVFHNKSRPLLAAKNIFNTPRNEQYFISRPWLKEPYLNAVQFLQSENCSKVGLSLEEETFTSTTVPWEYPLWPVANQKGNITQFEHINVKNASAAKSKLYPHSQFQPCGILAFEPENSPVRKRQKFVYKNITFMVKWSQGPVKIYLKNPDANSVRNPVSPNRVSGGVLRFKPF